MGGKGAREIHFWWGRRSQPNTNNYTADQPGASSIAFWSWENLALMSSDLCFWNRDEEGDQQSPHWRKKETVKESRFFHLYFVDSKGCLFFNLVPPFTTFLKEERAQYVFILSFLMLLQREKSTKNKLLKKWQICSNNNKKKSGSKKLTSVTGVSKLILPNSLLPRRLKPVTWNVSVCKL